MTFALRSTYFVRQVRRPMMLLIVAWVVWLLLMGAVAVSPGANDGTDGMDTGALGALEGILGAVVFGVLITYRDARFIITTFLRHGRNSTTIGTAGVTLRSGRESVTLESSSVTGFEVLPFEWSRTWKLGPVPVHTSRRASGLLHARLADGRSVLLPGLERTLGGDRFAGVQIRGDESTGWQPLVDSRDATVQWTATTDEAFFALLMNTLDPAGAAARVVAQP